MDIKNIGREEMTFVTGQSDGEATIVVIKPGETKRNVLLKLGMKDPVLKARLHVGVVEIVNTPPASQRAKAET